MQCSRCGASDGQIEYGTDGLAYCSSCIFYSTNGQCYRCRMYLPTTEMQQYRGQLCCQYCIADLRSADRAKEQLVEKISKDEPSAASDLEPEYCDICKKELSTVFILNGLKLCENCLEKEKKKWKWTGSEKPPMWMIRVKESKDKWGLLRSLIRALNELIRGSKKPSEKNPAKEKTEENKKEAGEKKTPIDQNNKKKESFKDQGPLEEKSLKKSKGKRSSS